MYKLLFFYFIYILSFYCTSVLQLGMASDSKTESFIEGLSNILYKKNVFILPFVLYFLQISHFIIVCLTKNGLDCY